jgi:hypothetical protein
MLKHCIKNSKIQNFCIFSRISSQNAKTQALGCVSLAKTKWIVSRRTMLYFFQLKVNNCCFSDKGFDQNAITCPNPYLSLALLAI